MLRLYSRRLQSRSNHFSESAGGAACGCTARRLTKMIVSREAAMVQRNLHIGLVTYSVQKPIPKSKERAPQSVPHFVHGTRKGCHGAGSGHQANTQILKKFGLINLTSRANIAIIAKQSCIHKRKTPLNGKPLMLQSKRGHPLHIFDTSHGAPDLTIRVGNEINCSALRAMELYKEGLHQRLLRIRLKG